MSLRSTVCDLNLIWDLSQASSASMSQRWVLSAMHKQGPALVTLLWRILGNEQDVCDAYQETFLNLAHYNGRKKPDNVAAYLYRTATNVAISILRRRKLRSRSVSKIAETHSEFNKVDYGQELDSRYLQQKLRKAIAKLPEYMRNVVVLRDLAELPYAKVSRILGISTGTARIYRCKAVALLSKWMAKDKE